MKKFLSKNITRTGRIMRFAMGLVMLAAGIVALAHMLWLAILFFVSSAFVFFEAARGWCFLRACGIKTKL